MTENGWQQWVWTENGWVLTGAPAVEAEATEVAPTAEETTEATD